MRIGWETARPLWGEVPIGAMLRYVIFQYESIIRFNRAAAFVRWWWFLFWRPDYWRQRDWPDSFDMPDRLYQGWISGESLVVCASPDGFIVSM
jgi:hypothetical protein